MENFSTKEPARQRTTARVRFAQKAGDSSSSISSPSYFLQICNKTTTTLVIFSTTAEASSSYLTTQTGVSTHQEAPLKLVSSLLVLGPLRYCYTQILLVFFTSKKVITKLITKLITKPITQIWY